MLAIRLQRVGRKALPMYRLAVQDAARHPSSGRVVTYVGSYNPHTKVTTLDREKIATHLKNGAQPTPRVVRILLTEKVELPNWVKQPVTTASKVTRKPGKLRKNQPKQAVAAGAPVTAAETPVTEAIETPEVAETSTEA